MIEHGKETIKLWKHGKNPTRKIIRGYYLVRESDGSRFFISKNVNVCALETVAERVLSDKHGYDYWIDYCMGYDVNGALEWTNLDFTDRFI